MEELFGFLGEYIAALLEFGGIKISFEDDVLWKFPVEVTCRKDGENENCGSVLEMEGRK